MTDSIDPKISNTGASASAEQVLTNNDQVYVQEFVVYPGGRKNRAPEPGEPLPVFFIDDFDLAVATNKLEGHGPQGSTEGIVCVFVNQDEDCHEVRMTSRVGGDRVAVLSAAIEQLSIVRGQLERLEGGVR